VALYIHSHTHSWRSALLVKHRDSFTFYQRNSGTVVADDDKENGDDEEETDGKEYDDDDG
jgi:hypothetical protein